MAGDSVTRQGMSRALRFTFVCLLALVSSCASPESDGKQAAAEPVPPAAATPAHAAPSAPPEALEELARPEPLALHMRDHLAFTTQARDAVIRGQLIDATGALTWLAQHRDNEAEADAAPFLDRIRGHAQGALDAKDLRGAAEALGAVAASCGDCHRATGRGPKLEPSGLEELGEALTVETHMHGYLWATDTLWNALIGDAAIWQTGIEALASLKPPAKPRKLASGFAAIAAWAKSAGNAQSSAERGRAYGELIATCGGCHVANAVNPGRTR